MIILFFLGGFYAFGQQASEAQISKITSENVIEYTFDVNLTYDSQEVSRLLSRLKTEYQGIEEVYQDENQKIHIKTNSQFIENESLDKIIKRFRYEHYSIQTH